METKDLPPNLIITRIIRSRPTQVIALARLVMVAVAVAAVYIAPPQAHGRLGLIHLVLVSFLVWALILLWAGFGMRLGSKLSVISHLVDFAVIVSLMELTDAVTSPFFVFFTFLLISASLQWDWRGVLITTTALLAVLLVFGAGGLETDLGRFILRSVYIIVVGLMLAYFSAYRDFIREQLSGDKERERIARDMHDTILQALTATNLSLKLLAQKAESGLREELEATRRLLVEEQKRLRAWVDSVRQAADEKDTALAPLGQEFVDQLQAYWNCVISIDVRPKDAEVPATIAAHLHRLLSEAVANAVRHGNASRVSIEVNRLRKTLDLKICDNGGGFEKESLTSPEAMPRSIYERVNELGGTLTLSGSPEGTKLRIQLPVSTL